MDGDVAGGVDGGLVDVDALLDDGAVGVAVDGGADYVDLVTVLGLEAGAVFTFSDVNDRAVRTMRPVDLNAGLSVGGLRPGGWGLGVSSRAFSCYGASPGVAGSTALLRCDWEYPSLVCGALARKKQWCFRARSQSSSWAICPD